MPSPIPVKSDCTVQEVGGSVLHVAAMTGNWCGVQWLQKRALQLSCQGALLGSKKPLEAVLEQQLVSTRHIQDESSERMLNGMSGNICLCRHTGSTWHEY